MCDPNSSRTCRSEGGFTVLEVMVAALTAMTLLAGFGGYYLRQQRNLQEQQTRLAMAQGIRAALDVMVRELRSAGRNPQAINGLAGIKKADRNAVEFTLDLNGDGTVTGNDEVRGFQKNGTTLEMKTQNTITNYTALLDGLAPGGGVNDAIFRYYPSGADPFDRSQALGNSPTADELASINAIEITLTGERRIRGRTISQTEVAVVDLRNQF